MPDTQPPSNTQSGSSPEKSSASPVPLCVDLDGTLVATDTLWEGFLQLVRHRPLTALSTLPALLQGRPAFKRRVASLQPLDAVHLPYRPQVQALIDTARAAGQPVWLATGTDHANAAAVADHLDCFDGILATNPPTPRPRKCRRPRQQHRHRQARRHHPNLRQRPLRLRRRQHRRPPALAGRTHRLHRRGPRQPHRRASTSRP